MQIRHPQPLISNKFQYFSAQHDKYTSLLDISAVAINRLVFISCRYTSRNDVKYGCKEVD